MLVTKLEEHNKKIRVYLDGEYLFWLYKSEISSHKIKEGSEMTEDEYASIYKNILLIRVKKYALSILERMDRTEYELRTKLKKSEYTETLIDEAIAYVKKYSYINDYQYTVHYVKTYMHVKSKRFIQNKLMNKGIEKQMIADVFLELDDEVRETGGVSPETLALKKEIDKKTRNKPVFTIKDKQKLFASLCRKGFDYDMIQRELACIELRNEYDEYIV